VVVVRWQEVHIHFPIQNYVVAPNSAFVAIVQLLHRVPNSADDVVVLHPLLLYPNPNSS
jgi:hypothetical protein